MAVETGRSDITVLLVDDHAVVREGLAARIAGESGMTLVGACADAEAAIEQVRSHGPDVVLMDIDMPGLNCFAACRTILAEAPGTRLIFVSAHSHDGYIDQALDVQAWGYVTKGDPVETVCAAVRAVAAGRVYFSADVKSRLVAADGGSGANGSNSLRSRRRTLSPRELEVLRYLATGKAVKEVAKTMHLSRKTVENHRSNIMGKLDIHDRVELARFAFREGIATVE